MRTKKLPIAVIIAAWLGIILIEASLAANITPDYNINITQAQRDIIQEKINLWQPRLAKNMKLHIDFVNIDSTVARSGLIGKARPGVEPAIAVLPSGEEVVVAWTMAFEADAQGTPKSAIIKFNSNAAVSWHYGDVPVPGEKMDFWTIVNHEIVHAAGFTVEYPKFRSNVTPGPGDKRTYKCGNTTATLTPEGYRTHLDPSAHPGDLMNPTINTGERRTPSALDITMLTCAWPLDGLPVGWSKVVTGCGGYAHVKHINDVGVPLSQDPCVAAIGPAWCEIQDSVLVFYDEGTPGYPHPLCQDNYAKSPVIDFSAYDGLPGRILTCERFGSLPETEYIFIYWQVRYKPGCESGGWSPWANDNYVYYTAEGTSCRPMTFDVSTWVPPEAEEAQAGYGVINYCDEDPWGRGDCTYTCNHTPYFDNVSFGVFGSDEAPYISMRELDFFQDQFAEDGTLNKLSTADTRTANYLSNLVPPIFGDTMNCRGTADDMEAWLTFRMAKVSPWQPTTHAFFTTWFPTATGGGWQSARMDTTEVTNSAGTGTILVAGRYMSTFHESDVRALPELTEILPNNLFVPGTRVEYRVKARYVGSGNWFSIPDTTLDPEEFEILPMYKDDGEGGLEWAPLLVADHFGQRGNWFERNSDRIARHLDSLDYHYDMFNKLGPTSDLRNGIGRMAANPGQIGGPGTPKYNWGPGATLNQFLAYSHCMLNSGTQLNNSMNESDVDVVNSWLNLYSSTDRFKFFWASGDQLVRWLYNQAAWGRPFINNVLGSTYVDKNYANLAPDYTYCLPLNLVAGGYLNAFNNAMVARSNGCTRTFNVLGVSGTTPNAKAERQFDSRPTARYASVLNSVSVVGGANYRTVSEGYDNCVIRTDGSLGYPACGDDEVMTDWLYAVLTWGNFSPCHWATPIGIDDPNSAVPPAVQTSLANAYPNPMNPTATIWYTVGTPGKVMLRVFDVSGRVIRTLVDETKVTGRYSVIWDGSNDRGEKVASGVFFYQLEGTGYKSAKKLVILQ